MLTMSDDCVICGKWPAKDRWALREMTTSLPLDEEPICDKCLESFWRSLPHTNVPPKPTSN